MAELIFGVLVGGIISIIFFCIGSAYADFRNKDRGVAENNKKLESDEWWRNGDRPPWE